MNEPRGERRPHILVVEDNPGDVYLLRLALEHAELDCELTVIEDGGDAFAFIRERTKDPSAGVVHLVLLDLNLPKNSGVEVLQEMQASPAFAATPIIILSSSSSPRDVQRIQSSGVGHYITKPVDLDEFLEIGQTIRKLLSDIPRRHRTAR